MKKIEILLLIMFTASIYPQSYNLNVWSKGKVTTIPVKDIKRITFYGVTGVEDSRNAEFVIKNFEVFQNYPNPFNPSTKIDYQIPGTGNVSIQIYNINGELVKTLTNAHQTAGRYSIVWDGRSSSSSPVASGVYIYRVLYGSSVLSRKMLLLK